eukprot:TRINITY_DN9013_c0_g1_i5.p1 TRINITY_DN9013_c0_g1~~TRINITY_DN9013_c0_g1_i5.p1  ORF type:complete len:746 (-),score=152.93 TRINITY_DN9013_c0_g1_i5:134-2371(-)
MLSALLLVVLCVKTHAQDEIDSVYCTFPKPSRNLPFTCAAVNASSSEKWPSLAVQFAPVVYFHPLETMFLAEPDATFFQGSAYIPLTGGLVSLSNPSEVFSLIYSPTYRMFTLDSYMTLLNNSDYDQIVTGAAFDANGNSTASIYYTVIEDESTNTVVFSYNMYYAATGCSNQLMAANASSISNPMILNYLLCNLGLQEANWQNVRVRVCASSLEIVQIAYNQHSWNEILDCTQGECMFDEANHPMVYAALNSHASYGYESDNIIYDKFQQNLGLIIDGIYLVDRTMKDSERRFYPNDANVLPLPVLGNISNGSTEIWAAWESDWTAPFDNEPVNVYCFLDNVSLSSNCSFSPLAVLLNEFLEAAQSERAFLFNTFLNLFTAMESQANEMSGEAGPWTYNYNYAWEDLGSAPIYSQTSNPQCPAALEYMIESGGNSTGTTATTVQTVPSKTYAHLITSQVIAVLALVLVVLLVLGSVLCLRRRNQFIEYQKVQVEEGIVLDLPVASRPMLFRIGVFSLIALGLGITGLVIIIKGIVSIRSALEGLSQSSAWNTLLSLYEASVPLILLIDVISLVTMLVVNSRSIAHQCPTGRVSCCCGHCCNALSISLLVLVIFVSMFTFGFGMIMFFLQYILNTACHNISARVVGVCVNMNSVGINLNFCGEQLFNVCTTWDNMDVPFLTWGPILFNISHIAFLLLNVMIFVGILNFEVALDHGVQLGALEVDAQSEQELIPAKDDPDPVLQSE